MKHYKIVRIAPLHYSVPKVALYKNNPELHLQPFADQQRALLQMGYVYSDSFSRGMRSLGHKAYEIVYDLEILQKTWAKEKGIKYDPDRWQYDIILAQIEDLKPDIIHFQGKLSVSESIAKNLKQNFPFVKLITVYVVFPVGFNKLSDVDVLYAGTPALVRQYQEVGLRPYLIYHSFDDSILEKMSASSHDEYNPKYDFTFVGSSGYGYGLSLQARYWSLVELIQRTNLELWVYELKKQKIPIRAKVNSQMRKSFKRLLRNYDAETLIKMLTLSLVPIKLRKAIHEVIEQKHKASEQNHCDTTSDEPRLPKKPLHKMFPYRCYDSVFGIDMYRILYQSKVTFNRHTDAAEDSVGNVRMFHATGVGTCLLTDAGKNISDLFEEDHEVVTYSSMDDCIEKVNYLLNHHDVRRQIAVAGQRRTLKNHTVLNRCKQMDEILQKIL